MRKLFIAIFICFICVNCFTSCAVAGEVDGVYYTSTYNGVENVVVKDGICYVYYSNPSTVFLNTLHVIDGRYYYTYSGSYIPVVFPYWDAWSPHRYFYYDCNRWAWRDRIHYNHAEYRRSHWGNYRRPMPSPNRFVPNSGGFRQHNVRPQVCPPRRNVPNSGNFNRPNGHNGRRFGGGR